jgi:hypothetical protein
MDNTDVVAAGCLSLFVREINQSSIHYYTMHNMVPEISAKGSSCEQHQFNAQR